MKLIADKIVTSLSRAGIDTVYGLPGGEVVVFLEALRQQGIRFVLVRHETSAAFMADMAGRLTKKPAVCLTTLGPGATNVVTGVANAFLDRSPIIVITAQKSCELQSEHTHQMLDLQALFSPITKASLQLTSDGFDEVLEKAIALTTSGKPGPVHLQLTNEDASRPASTGESTFPPLQNVPKSTVDCQAEIEKARILLQNAKKPVVICGLGLEPEGAYEELTRLIENTRSPLITTPKAKGCLPEDHPLVAGVIGLTHSDPVYELIGETDCILAIGFDVVELVRPWNEDAPLIWLATWPNNDPKIAAEIEMVGPIGDILDELSPGSFTWDSNWGEARVRRYHNDNFKRELPVPATGRLLPQEVLRVVREYTPRDTIVVSDVGSHKIFAALNWKSYTPNSFHLSNGLSSMGYAIPAAVAAILNQSNRVVVALVGDGGLQMSMGELSLLSDLNGPLVVMLFKDGALDLIRSHQIGAGYQPFGTEFSDLDYRALAEGFGLDYFQVRNVASCSLAINSAIKTNRPVFIEAVIDPAGYPTTPIRRS